MVKPKIFLQSLILAFVVLCAGCSSSNPGQYFENDGPPGFFQKKFFSWGGGDVQLKVEEPNKWANRPYTVRGTRYYPVTGDKPMTQVGTASWYGKQFHGNKTAIGEIYDMNAMTAAHPTMELPSYAKVTNLQNGRSVIVRVNDRGPFLHDRIIDLSYAAAVKLGYQKQGTARVRVERITRRDIAAGKIPSTSANSVVIAKTQSPSSEPSATVTGKTVQSAPKNESTSVRNDVALQIPVESVEKKASESMKTLLTQEKTQSIAELAASSASTSKLGAWSVQIGAFGMQENARQAAAHAEMMLNALDNANIRVVESNNVWKVLSGNFSSKDEAAAFARTITQTLGTSAFAVAQ